jgi:transcriptional regulator with XRE-family HTH domain
MGLGEKVRAAREARGWSQRQLAEAVTAQGFPISQTGIDKIEKRNTARPKCLPELIKVLGLEGAPSAEPDELAAGIDIGKSILERRTALGLSQAELATRMNTDKSTISRWESGETALNADRLLEVSAALKIPAAALLGQKDQAAYYVEAADEIDPMLLAAWRRLSRRSRRQLVQFALIMAGEG